MDDVAFLGLALLFLWYMAFRYNTRVPSQVDVKIAYWLREFLDDDTMSPAFKRDAKEWLAQYGLDS
jgi:hypothetical protein